ncbi:unnamed protein product [Larinioides sclopetarius]|uniref:Uncharacterized protein n=1 Tax=Larinioides sclopetarius TaxID=280406 RepID=A0AAV2B3T8_9ARAC
MCFTMTISTEVFCRFNSQYCEKPNNLEEFCKKHPIYCGGNTSSLRELLGFACSFFQIMGPNTPSPV